MNEEVGILQPPQKGGILIDKSYSSELINVSLHSDVLVLKVLPTAKKG